MANILKGRGRAGAVSGTTSGLQQYLGSDDGGAATPHRRQRSHPHRLDHVASVEAPGKRQPAPSSRGRRGATDDDNSDRITATGGQGKGAQTTTQATSSSYLCR